MTRHPLTGGSAAALWAQYLTAAVHRKACRWTCRICGDGTLSRDPAAAIRRHLAEAHGEPQWTGDPFDHVTPTRVSTDVRDSIWRGVR